MNKSKICLLAIAAAFMLTFISGCSTTANAEVGTAQPDSTESDSNIGNASVDTLLENESDMPKEAQALIDAYMDALKKGVHEAIKYIHFEDDWTETAYLESNNNLRDYFIESTEKVNSRLIALTIQYRTMISDETGRTQGEGTFEMAYNFVGLIDGEWRYINGIRHIPVDLRENLDESKYTYSDSSIVDSEDVLHQPLFEDDLVMPVVSTYRDEIMSYLSELFNGAYGSDYDGLRYEMTNYEETITDTEYSATFCWTMFYFDNGLEITEVDGNEQEANMFLKATAGIMPDGQLDMTAARILADNTVTDPATHQVPVEDLLPLRVDYGSSSRFSRSEIESAVEAVIAKFVDFDGCEMRKIWYDEIKSDNFILSRSWGQGNIIVLLSDFYVSPSGGDGSLDRDSTYTNWMWILTRDDAESNWIVWDWGY